MANIIERKLPIPAQLKRDEDGDYESAPTTIPNGAELIYVEHRFAGMPTDQVTHFSVSDSAFMVWNCRGKSVITVNEIDLPHGDDPRSVYVIVGYAVEMAIG